MKRHGTCRNSAHVYTREPLQLLLATSGENRCEKDAICTCETWVRTRTKRTSGSRRILKKKVALSIHWCLSAITQALSSETLPTDWFHNARIAFHLQHRPSRAIHLWTDLQFLCASCMPCWWHPDLLSHEETRLNTETPPTHALEGLSNKQGISKTGELPNQKERFRSSWLVSIPIFGSKQQITSKEFCPDRPTNLKMVWVYPTQHDHSDGAVPGKVPAWLFHLRIKAPLLLDPITNSNGMSWT